jgi:hypothetical protein
MFGAWDRVLPPFSSLALRTRGSPRRSSPSQPPGPDKTKGSFQQLLMVKIGAPASPAAASCEIQLTCAPSGMEAQMAECRCLVLLRGATRQLPPDHTVDHQKTPSLSTAATSNPTGILANSHPRQTEKWRLAWSNRQSNPYQSDGGPGAARLWGKPTAEAWPGRRGAAPGGGCRGGAPFRRKMGWSWRWVARRRQRIGRRNPEEVKRSVSMPRIPCRSIPAVGQLALVFSITC